MATALDNGRRSPRKLLPAVVARQQAAAEAMIGEVRKDEPVSAEKQSAP